jgi:CRISPR/Cas system CSM-associated protein Csm3 (group 7 of RAMP superfamily)
MIEIDVTLTFTTPPNVGSGAQEGTWADRALIKDRDGWPFIPATTFKGCLRHAVERAARGAGRQVCATHRKMCRDPQQPCPACRIFGSPWIPGRLCFVDLTLQEPDAAYRAVHRHPRIEARYGVAINRRRGVASDALLYTTEVFRAGKPLVFQGTLAGAIELADAAWLVAGLGLLTTLGRARSTGLGWLRGEAAVRAGGQPVDAAALRSALAGGAQ